jgi:hypothetical protein
MNMERESAQEKPTPAPLRLPEIQHYPAWGSNLGRRGGKPATKWIISQLIFKNILIFL